jgi:hypothetical protein
MHKIKNKLEALLRMTEKNGATEDEAATAMSLAAALAAKHGIDLDALNNQKVTPAKSKMSRKKFDINKMPHWTFCAQAAASLMGVAFDAGSAGFEFIGREELVEAAEQTMFWLFRQVEELYKQALVARGNDLGRTMSQRERGEFRKTFKPACAKRVKERAVRLMWQMKRDERTAQQTTGHNALVVAGYFNTLEKEINEFRYGPPPTPEQRAQWKREAEQHAESVRKWREANPKEAAKQDREDARWQARWEAREAKRRERSKPDIPTGSGTSAGYAAGERVQLRREVE